jgi:hypothetical protein
MFLFSFNAPFENPQVANSQLQVATLAEHNPHCQKN